MKKNKDILTEAIQALYRTKVPAGPAKETIDATVEKLNQITDYQALINISRQRGAWGLVVKIAAVVVITVGLLGGIIFFRSPDKKPVQKIVKPPKAPAPKVQVLPQTTSKTISTPDLETDEAKKRLEAEITQIIKLVTSSNIKGLVALLSSGSDECKIIAANFLSEMGDSGAIEHLEKLSAQWTDEQGENPFAKAIQKIKERPGKQKEPAPATAKDKVELLQSQFKPEGVLSGLVIDAKTGEPAGDVRITLRGPVDTYAVTDANGIYSIDTIEQDGEYQIRVSSKEYFGFERLDEMPVISLDEYSRITQHFELTAACQVEIEVVDEANEPIKGIIAIATSLAEEHPRDIVQDEKTDEGGLITVGSIKPLETPYLITILHERYVPLETNEDFSERVSDYAPSKVQIKLTDPNIIEFRKVVLKKGAEVKGYAEYTDGDPAEGLEVIAKPDWWHCSYSLPGYRIDPNGEFTLEHIVEGNYNIYIYFPEEDSNDANVPVWQITFPIEEESLFLQIP